MLANERQIAVQDVDYAVLGPRLQADGQVLRVTAAGIAASVLRTKLAVVHAGGGAVKVTFAVQRMAETNLPGV